MNIVLNDVNKSEFANIEFEFQSDISFWATSFHIEIVLGKRDIGNMYYDDVRLLLRTSIIFRFIEKNRLGRFVYYTDRYETYELYVILLRVF